MVLEPKRWLDRSEIAQELIFLLESSRHQVGWNESNHVDDVGFVGLNHGLFYRQHFSERKILCGPQIGGMWCQIFVLNADHSDQ